MKTPTLSRLATSLSFAHLAGLGRKNAKAKAEDKDDDKTDDEGERDHEDGDVKKNKKAKGKSEGDQPQDGEEEEEARAEDDDPDAENGDDQPGNSDGDEDDDGDKKGKKAKKAKADDDGDDNDDEMRGQSPIAKARKREQARCAAIFGSPAAARNPVLAANLAFKSRMSRSEALAILEATPGSVDRDRSARAASNPRIGAGGPPSQTSAQAIAASWDKALAATRPR